MKNLLLPLIIVAMVIWFIFFGVGGTTYFTDSVSGSIKEVSRKKGLQTQESFIFKSPTFDERKARWTLGVDGSFEPPLLVRQCAIFISGSNKVAIELTATSFGGNNTDFNYISSMLGRWRPITAKDFTTIAGIPIMWFSYTSQNDGIRLESMATFGSKMPAVVDLYYPVSREFAEDFVLGNTNPPIWYRFPHDVPAHLRTLPGPSR